MFKRILVPLDGSAFAEAALQPALAMAKCMGSEIELLRVAIHPSNYVYVSDPATLAQLYDSDRAHCEDYLKAVVARFSDAGVKMTYAVLDGVVADSIVDYAEDTDADLIVMSTHGRTGMERWLLGSVAERVVRGAKMPVLLIRPQRQAEAKPE